MSNANRIPASDATQVATRRIQHAGHYAYGVTHQKYGRGHDLEEWTYAQPARLPKPSSIPSDAEYHSGFVRDGAQHWVYLRRAPMTGTCPRCASVSL